MSSFIVDWLNLAFRWAHLVVGIGWIGTSFYFIALDLSLRKREGMGEGVSGTAWEVHGGGFYHVEKYLVAPNAQLTAIVDNWGPYYIKRVQDYLAGTWESQQSWDGLAEGTVQMSDYTNMPDDVADAARQVEAMITTGEFHPFTGPIFKQDGTQVAADGEVMDDVSLLTMDYYVQGLDGTPGQ